MRLEVLETEIGVERSSFERERTLVVVTGAPLTLHWSEPIVGNQDGRPGIGDRRDTRSVFSNEGGDVPHNARAGVATFCCGARRLRVIAALADWRLAAMTPELAEQRRLGRHGECQRDRKDDYSKHVLLARLNGKDCASSGTGSLGWDFM